jgi:hypothetical protein
MHEKKLENILNKFSKIIAEAPNVPVAFDHLSGNGRILARGQRRLYLAGEDLDTYNQVLKNLTDNERWGDKFSEKHIDSILVDTILDFLENGIESAKESLRKACTTVETYSVEQTIYIPLGGIQMYDIEEITIGKVQITLVPETRLKEILEATHKITRLTNNSAEEQEYFIRQDSEILSEVFLDSVCSVYRVVAEPLRARELAEQETHRALDLLRYSIPALHLDKDKVEVGLSSQVPSSFQPSLALSSIGFEQGRRRLNYFYEISRKNCEILERMHIFELSEVLTKSHDQVNEFEKILLRGIHWFACSQTQVERENKILNLTTCLEVFFTPEERDPISNSIAEGVALVLGKDLIERKHLKKRVKDLYSLRSKISHGKHKTVLDQDMIDLQGIAMSLLIKMTEWRKDFFSLSDLMNWLEERKLS